MYKKASQIWQHIRPDKASASGFAKAARKAARAYLNRKLKVPCPRCSDLFLRRELSGHIFATHELAKCKYCAEYVSLRQLQLHIHSKHGAETFDKWLKTKRKEAMRPGGLIRSATTEALITENGELVLCPACAHNVDANFLSIHRARYCKRK